MNDNLKSRLRAVKAFVLNHGPLGNKGRGAWVSRKTRFEYKCNVFVGERARIAEGCQLAAGTGRIEIGDGSMLHSYVVIRTGGQGGLVRIGNNCTINSFSCLLGLGGLVIEDNVMFAPNVTAVAQSHIHDSTGVSIKEQGSRGVGIKICSGVWVGANSVILDGVTIGEGAIISAGSVVMRDVAPYDIVAGNPARPMRNRKDSL